jgi:hypothetical protein
MTNVSCLCSTAEVKPGGGKATGPSKSTHLSHEEVYFKTLLSDPRVKRGEYRKYLNRAIVEAIDFLESRAQCYKTVCVSNLLALIIS